MNRILIFLTIIVGFIIYVLITNEKLQDYKEKLNIAESNSKALLLDNEGLNNSNRMLQLTLEQVNYYNDSITRALKNTINKSNSKDAKIEQLQYMLATNFRVDTLIFKDTIFVKDYYVDTTITDNKWYSLNMTLSYPNNVTVAPKFTNEYTTIFSSKKETVYPPKKCFLLRWFQKKHTIVEVSVFNNNPYSTIDTTRFIKTIK